MAMSSADLAVGLPIVRDSRVWICSRSIRSRPTTWPAKMVSITATMPAWVSP